MLALHKAPIRRWVALLFAAGMLAACQEDAVDPVSEAEAKLHAAPRPAKIFTVTDQIGLLERRFAGRVAAVKTVDLSFQVPGKLVALPVLESQRVKEGDLIATLDTTDYDRAVREATINAEQAKRELDRLETLRERSVISQSAYDEQKNKHDLALETLKEAKQNLEYTTLKAPFDGIVSVRLVDNFTTVSVGTPVVRLHDVSEVQVDINVAEALFGRVSESEVASIEARFPAYGDKLFPLTYREHSSQVDDVAQTYRITLAMPRDGAEQLSPGMTASVTVKFLPEGLELGEQFLVPSSAIAVDGDGSSYVWKFDADTGAVSKNPVEIGTVMGDFIPVRSGLDKGDDIVSAGVAYLSDGQVVRRLN
ncbi:efflux RND transporter periplasmic adaptor subunit [Labrenzia sp. PO1]|uniref:efflux RND transporter periplasmic adaptor subunit n=1 Tax=Labrenzia sp. PO1 TaxID=2720390 RepID=UPI00144731A9|nr:efflux RND transporter periplasmic adaptor subunit [Labrenzia sp. PO1]MCR9282396.1 efflux RND transporter periplasmic adaptor subunit [Paracoccaceae bacterium]NKI60313.1 efflux RND transporter periplasmic adaptor subunit [Labrenzia sp. PO1]